MIGNQLKNQHLWWRAGFGPAIDQTSAISEEKPDLVFHTILKDSEKKPVPLEVADPDLKSWIMEHRSRTALQMPGLKSEQRQMLRRQSVQDIARLNLRWLQEMTESPAQLLEKMSLFWHGHFASKTIHILFDQDLLQIIRENALGNFSELLMKVSKSASMIQFLNNNQNRKGHPNENFARELMELFTVGRGNYSETDVKESARAFTGWGANLQGDFEFHPRQHDDGSKTFFGKTGNLSGEDIIEILLAQKQTATFITGKIYRYFVNETIDEGKLHFLAARFFESGYDIRDLMIRIFTSSWFYEEKNIGTQIKSPVLWWVGIRRQLPMQLQNPAAQLIVERLLGQVLFSPPNVAGWPGGKHWIDSSSLMLRMQIPQIIYQSDMMDLKPKDDDDLMMGMREGALAKNIKKLKNPGLQLFRAEIFWDEYTKNFNGTKTSALYTVIRNLLLQRDLPIKEKDMIRLFEESGREQQIQSMTIRLMGTPEYQLC